MAQLSFGQAVNNALDLAMTMDESVFLAGEGIGVSIHYDPNMPSHGLLEKYGPKRVKDTPVSEAAIAGLAVGASCMGLHPVVEIMFLPFITLATDMLVNHAGKLRYLSGGKSSFPLTVRIKAGVNFAAGCQHSHNLEAWLAHSPGLKVVFPSTAEDAKGMLLSAIFDPNPVIVIEEMGLYWAKGEVPEGDYRVPLGKARIAMSGDDCTIVSYGGAIFTAIEAASILSKENISAEVIDLRSLVPLDRDCLLNSVKKTGRLVVLHDATKFGGFGAEIAAIVAEDAFEFLKAHIKRVAAPDIPVPFSPPQEKFYKPGAGMVVDAVRSVMRGRAGGF
uniref:Acetoin:2,6-dichlorophenolindophenol oxidoreductase subunit beta n=1 Tax=uncultured Desulfobacterium sp. TaxID=201089 RepID=E1YGE2_9BACT|nr:Acetoin:2,6-dichlorophenolindophenol oxidoreductase subunit beta [uncultured Desulfobacterium sp.]